MKKTKQTRETEINELKDHKGQPIGKEYGYADLAVWPGIWTINALEQGMHQDARRPFNPDRMFSGGCHHQEAGTTRPDPGRCSGVSAI